MTELVRKACPYTLQALGGKIELSVHVDFM